jgi:hypothetical protein
MSNAPGPSVSSTPVRFQTFIDNSKACETIKQTWRNSMLALSQNLYVRRISGDLFFQH